jgi:hypothetical protein
MTAKYARAVNNAIVRHKLEFISEQRDASILSTVISLLLYTVAQNAENFKPLSSPMTLLNTF